MEFKELAKARKSVQFFDKDFVMDEGLVKEIYELASLAPTSFNLQPVKIILVGDEAWKEKLRKCAFNQEKVAQASYLAVLLGDLEGYKGDEMNRALDGFIANGYFGEEMRESMAGMAKQLYEGKENAFVSRNVGLFAMSFMYAAKNHGIDTHPMDGFDAGALRETFSIPERYEPVMIIAMGKFDESKTEYERKERKPFDEVVVKESF